MHGLVPHAPVGPAVSPDGIAMKWACARCGARMACRPVGHYCGHGGCQSQEWYLVGDAYALKYFREIDGKPAWFQEMTGIGPRLTDELCKAMQFETKQEASRHPAANHPICLLDPAPIRSGVFVKEGV